jgi:hypothetical protein
VKVSPLSGSVEPKVPTVELAATFSSMAVGARASAVGASFSGFTVTVKVCSVLSPPASVVRTRMS